MSLLNSDIEDLTNETTVTMIESAMVYRKQSISEIFEDEDYDVVDILEQLLVFHPDKRLNVEEVLAHPYLRE